MIKNSKILEKSKLISVVAITLFLVLVAGIVWMVVAGIINQQDSSDTPLIDQSGEVFDIPDDPTITTYNTPQESIDKQDWTKATIDFKKYGYDDSNPKPLRITAFANCAWAAQNSGQASEEAVCLEAGRAVLSQLSDEDREEAQRAFDATSAGKTYSNTEVAPGDIRE
jgi:hypothetical protein